jgi:hypothetical protein
MEQLPLEEITMSQTTLAQLRGAPLEGQTSVDNGILSKLLSMVDTTKPVSVGMETVQGFEALQRIAKLFASSNIVPPQYNQLPNAVIAVDMAMRMNANPLMVMQNMFTVYNRPAWSSQFLIATFNKSGHFSPIRYEFQGEQGKDDWGCRASAIETATGEKLTGPLITIALAKAAGWYDKKDKEGKPASKWPTMPELMLRYRAAGWFIRTVAPEIAMGLHTVEEVRDGYTDAAPGLSLDDIAGMRPLAPEATPGAAPHTSDTPAAPEPEQPKAPAAPEPKAQASAEKSPPQDDYAGEGAMVKCPNNDKYVDELTCISKPCHDGCPEFE